MPLDYQNGKIYKIISPSTNLIYIGSTAMPRLSQRFAHHKGNFREFLNSKGRHVTSFEIIKYNDASIVLIESFPCDNREELLAREQYWLDNTQNKVNKCKSFTGLAKKDYQKIYIGNYRIENRDYLAKAKQEYRTKNKEVIAEKKKEYVRKNKNKVYEQRRKYREANREKIAQDKKNRYIENKSKILKSQKEYAIKNKKKITERRQKYYQRVSKQTETCECGRVIKTCKKSAHIKTNVHLQFIKSQTQRKFIDKILYWMEKIDELENDIPIII